MIDYKIIKLKNLCPWHLGIGKEDYDFSAPVLESDAIIAALTSIKASKGGKDNLKDFIQSFKLSSAFPYINNILFLPRMSGNNRIHVEGEDDAICRKRIKKIQFIEYPLWIELLKGNEIIAHKEQIQSSFLTCHSNYSTNIFFKQVVQRVAIPRDEESLSVPFFFEWTYFNNNDKCGLYCIVDCNKETFQEIVSLFETLGEIGIGTDKSVGGGKFEIDISNICFPEYKNTNASILLSTYIPLKDELKVIDFSNSSYDLLLRGGFMAGSSIYELRHLRRKSIYMFKPGSVLKTSQPLKGQIVDLAPNWNDNRMHPVYRSGIPFVVPFNID